MSLIRTPDDSVTDASGRLLYLSTDRFISDIVEGEACFICGIRSDAAEFNDEHVIPDWILRRYSLHNRSVTLPNETPFRYGQYKVPCCVSCNGRMGNEIEDPVAELFSKGYDALLADLKENGPLRLFTWLNLLFLKTHLKDHSLRLNRDRRREATTIGELYDWPELHHIHCVTRAFYTGAAIHGGVLGSLFLQRAKRGTQPEDFDYGDYYTGKTVFVRMEDVFLLAVLNDACGVASILKETFDCITGPLSPWQCREMVAHAAYANTLLVQRPVFRTELDIEANTLAISAEVPRELEKHSFEEAELQKIVNCMLMPCISASNVGNKSEILCSMRDGLRSFIFDEEGKFVDRPL